MADLSGLRIKTTENHIDNVEDFLKLLDEIELTEDVLAYLESLLNRLLNSTLENKGLLTSQITAKLVEHQNQQTELDNQESLRQIQEYNEDLKKIKIISTSMNDNDSGKDIEYITFTSEDGKVEMLSCESSKAISNFIKEHAEDVVKRSAEEIFNYFKEYIHRDVRFMSPEKMENDYPEISKTAVVNDEHIKTRELEEIEKYKERFGILDGIEVGIDHHGERLYRIGDGIIKFKNVQEGRQMVVLQKPTLEKSEELEVGNEETIEDEEPMVDSTEQTIEEPIDFKMNLEQFRSLVYDKEVNHRILSPKEERAILMYASLLISTMVERATQEERDFETEETLEDFMYDIITRYEALQEGMIHSSEITQQEINLAEQYLAKKEEIKGLELRKEDVKRLVLENNQLDSQSNQNAGKMYVLILLGIVVVGLFVLSYIAIVNR